MFSYSVCSFHMFLQFSSVWRICTIIRHCDSWQLRIMFSLCHIMTFNFFQVSFVTFQFISVFDIFRDHALLFRLSLWQLTIIDFFLFTHNYLFLLSLILFATNICFYHYFLWLTYFHYCVCNCDSWQLRILLFRSHSDIYLFSYFFCNFHLFWQLISLFNAFLRLCVIVTVENHVFHFFSNIVLTFIYF